MGSASFSKFSAAANQSSVANRILPPFYVTGDREKVNWEFVWFCFQLKSRQNYSMSGQLIQSSEIGNAHREQIQVQTCRKCFWNAMFEKRTPNKIMAQHIRLINKMLSICSAFLSLFVVFVYRIHFFLHSYMKTIHKYFVPERTKLIEYWTISKLYSAEVNIHSTHRCSQNMRWCVAWCSIRCPGGSNDLKFRIMRRSIHLILNCSWARCVHHWWPQRAVSTAQTVIIDKDRKNVSFVTCTHCWRLLLFWACVHVRLTNSQIGFIKLRK